MNEEVEKAKERARQDLVDIKTLRDTEAFSRYFIRRLTQKRDEEIAKLKYDSDEKLAKDGGREGVRRTMLAYEAMLGLIAQDEGAARNLVR